MRKIFNCVDESALVVLSGPSGVGKGTVCRDLLRRNPDWLFSVSATTRKPRCGDVDGVDYIFKNVSEFEKMILNDELLEWALYGDNYYGTPILPVLHALKDGRVIILEIETKGAAKIRDILPNATYIFLMPPDFGTLEERLRKRGSESIEEIKLRTEIAARELVCQNCYQHSVVNDDLNETVLTVENIIKCLKIG